MINRYFESSKDELSYDLFRLFQDNNTRVVTSVKSAQAGNVRMKWAMESKLLDFNLDKSCCIVIGPKKCAP